jgi:hypothetical protein
MTAREDLDDTPRCCIEERAGGRCARDGMWNEPFGHYVCRYHWQVQLQGVRLRPFDMYLFESDHQVQK